MKFFVAVLVLFFAYNAVSACSCRPTTEADKVDAVKNAKVIFYGKIISKIPTENYQIRVKFHVLKSWKGVETNEIVVTTASESSACGVNFRVGESSMIYSFDNPPSVNSCTMMLVDAKVVRETLGEGKSFEDMPPPQPESEEKSKSEESEGWLSWIWRKITSVFS